MAGPSLIATLGANITQFVRDLQTAKGHAKSEGAGIGSALGEGLASKLSGIASVTAIEEMIRRTVKWGSSINDLAFRLGMTRVEVQQWDYALRQNGSSLESQIPFFEKLGVARVQALEGNEKAIASFAKLGITLDQLRTGTKGEIAQAALTAYTKDPDNLANALKDIGGRGAGGMVAAFREGFNAILKDFRDSKLGVDEKIIAELDRADDAMERFRTKFRAMTAPEIAGLTKIATEASAVAERSQSKIVALAQANPGLAIASMVLSAIGASGPEPISTQTRPGALAEGMSVEEIKEMEKALKGKEGLPGGDIEGSGEGTGEGETKGERNERLASAKREREEARRDADTIKRTRPDAFEVNALQRIGGFVGTFAASQEMATFNVAQKSEGHLAAIRKAVERGGIKTPSDDVQF